MRPTGKRIAIGREIGCQAGVMQHDPAVAKIEGDRKRSNRG